MMTDTTYMDCVAKPLKFGVNKGFKVYFALNSFIVRW